jgi:hypothetical protein
MKIIWSATNSYRAFAHDNPPGFCLVSDRAASDGTAVVVGDSTVVGLDINHRVCDVEVARLTPSLLVLSSPTVDETVDGEIETTVEPSSSVQWSVSREKEAVQVGFGSGHNQVKWHRLGTNRLWLATSDRRELRAVWCMGVAFDPTGQKEARWLDDIGA